MNVISHRRALHAIAEPGFCEYETKKYILSVLSELTCKIYEIGNTGIAAFFDFNSNKTVAFRAELDALPINENTGLEFSSVTGYMHACGHDAHTAMLLFLAESLQNIKPRVNVLFIFQPAEEQSGGSESIISSGIFNNIKTDELFALHLKDKLKAGKIYCRDGIICAGSTETDVIFKGKLSHVDGMNNSVLISAAEFLLKVKASAEKNGYHINFGIIKGGSSRNIVPGAIELQGTVRYYSSDEKSIIKNILNDILINLKTENNISFRDYAPPLENSSVLFSKVNNNFDIYELDKPFPIADDFALYSKVIHETLYLFLGTGDTPPLHSDKFNFDERILYSGIDFFKSLLYFCSC